VNLGDERAGRIQPFKAAGVGGGRDDLWHAMR
jgi:hypothetical protein